MGWGGEVERESMTDSNAWLCVLFMFLLYLHKLFFFEIFFIVEIKFLLDINCQAYINCNIHINSSSIKNLHGFSFFGSFPLAKTFIAHFKSDAL